MVALGLTVERDPLPKRADDAPQEVELLPRGVHREKKAASGGKAFLASSQQKEPEAPGVVARQRGEGKAAEPREAGQELDLRAAAERGVLDIIRQANKIDFWRATVSESLRPSWLANWLGVDEGLRLPETRFVSLLKSVRKDYRTFQVGVEEGKDHYNPSEPLLNVKINLREGHEWRDAWEEAWTFAAKPNAYCLSDNALRLYEWAKSPKNTCELTERRKIGAHARLRKTYDDVEEHLREIRLKADPNMQWEKEGDLWRVRIRIWFEKRGVALYQHGPLNPPLALDLKEIYRTEVERFKTWLYTEIVKPEFPDGDELVGILDIRDRKTALKVFTKLPPDSGRFGKLPDLFRAPRLLDGIMIRTSFLEGCGPWIVTCKPAKRVTWGEIKTRLRAKAGEIPIEKKYTLSADSRALLAWILELRSDEYLLGMTPPLEDRFKGEIGIQADCGKENVKAYTELLVEEINERTELELRVIGWHHYGREETRILVKKKQADLERVVRAVQVFGLSKNKVLDGGNVISAIDALMGG